MEEVCRQRHPESGKLLQNLRRRARTSGGKISRRGELFRQLRDPPRRRRE